MADKVELTAYCVLLMHKLTWWSVQVNEAAILLLQHCPSNLTRQLLSIHRMVGWWDISQAGISIILQRKPPTVAHVIVTWTNHIV